jgi:hypothetical protein
MAKKKDTIQQEAIEANVESGEVMPTDVTITETSTTVAPSTPRSREWMNTKYPDKVWEDDAQYEEFLAEHLDEADKRLASYEEGDVVISDLMERNPEFALVMDAMAKGMPFRVALRRYLGDIFDDEPMSDDPDWEELKKASDEFLAEKKRADEEIATRNSNLEKSDILLTEFVERMFPSEKDQVDFVEYLRSTLRTIGRGEFTDAFFDMMYKAYMHDKDVEDAKEAGAIEARNEKITSKRIKAQAETDGMPTGGSSSPIVTEEEPEEDDFLGAAAKRYRNREFK